MELAHHACVAFDLGGAGTRRDDLHVDAAVTTIVLDLLENEWCYVLLFVHLAANFI